MKSRILLCWFVLSLFGCNGPESSMHRGNLAYRAGQLPEAAQHYQQALGFPETKAAASYNLGRVSLEQGDPAQAKEYFDQALELEVEFPEVRLYRARSLLSLDRADEARQDLERLTKSHADFMDGFLELAKLQFAEGQFKEATETAQVARQSRVLVEEATLLSAAAKKNSGDLQGAIAELEVLVASHGFRIPTHFTLAEYLLEAQDFREAERRYRRGLEMEPANSAGALGLADSLRGQGKNAEALELYSAVASSGPPDHPIVKKALERKAELQDAGSK